MKDLYAPEEFCMDFTGEEIEKYLIEPMREEYKRLGKNVLDVLTNFNPDNHEIIQYLKRMEELTKGDFSAEIEMYSQPDSIHASKYLFLDGATKKFYINFSKYRISVYISNEHLHPDGGFSFNEEFMFIDDRQKSIYCISDTHGNIVYEGTLRDKTHEEILQLLMQVILVLLDATAIKVEETVVQPTQIPNGNSYPLCTYVIYVTNDTGRQEVVEFKNIKFIVNG